SGQHSRRPVAGLFGDHHRLQGLDRMVADRLGRGRAHHPRPAPGRLLRQTCGILNLAMRKLSIDLTGAVLALAVLAAAPQLFGSSYIIGVLTVALCFGIWAASWDFMSGLTGRENFGHSLFIGAGAYTAGFLNVNFHLSPWWSLGAAPIVAVGFSIV